MELNLSILWNSLETIEVKAMGQNRVGKGRPRWEFCLEPCRKKGHFLKTDFRVTTFTVMCGSDVLNQGSKKSCDSHLPRVLYS